MRTLFAFSAAQTHDITYYASLMTTSAHTEIALGLIISCMPAVPQFLLWWAKRHRAASMLGSLLPLIKQSPGAATASETATISSQRICKGPMLVKQSDDMSEKIVTEHAIL
jgi:hypothetical protein